MHESRRQGIACIVDSDIAIDFLRARRYARLMLADWSAMGLLAVSTVTHLEVYQGMRKGEEAHTTAFLDGLASIPVDVEIARQAGTMLRELRSRGTTIGTVDAIIAATALRQGAALLTNNAGHYPFPGLRVISGLGGSA